MGSIRIEDSSLHLNEVASVTLGIRGISSELDATKNLFGFKFITVKEYGSFPDMLDYSKKSKFFH